jgi:A/G-specific adenine glycosylase
VTDRRARLRSAILTYYSEARRDLPWRRTRDPYAIWVSEVMLQQTRVDTVIPYYERFISRWPNVRSLSEAPADDVRAAWSGLGYYRRASSMMKAAASIVRDHRGEVPGDFAALERLPGFGRYTAGAVASIAFGVEVPAVDGNVLRVLARVDGVEGDVARGDANRAVWSFAEALVRGERPGDLNQGLIELGALVCTPKAPSCDVCPVAAECVALAQGKVHEIPAPKRRPKRRTIEMTALLSVDGERVLLEKQPEAGLFAGLWCLPMLEGSLEGDGLLDEAARRYGFAIDAIEATTDTKHVLTHRDLCVRVARVGGELAPPSSSFARVELSALDRIGIPSAMVRALEASLPPALLSLLPKPPRLVRVVDSARVDSA